MKTHARNEIQVAIIGAGLMGHGIAQVFAAAGHETTLTDADEAVLRAAPGHVAHNLAQMGIEPGPVLEKLRLRATLADAVSDAGIVIDIHGARAVQKIVVGSDAMQTTFDLAGRRIAIDRRMFPVACAAGDEMLQTADRLRHMTVEASETHLVLAATKGG